MQFEGMAATQSQGASELNKKLGFTGRFRFHYQGLKKPVVFIYVTFLVVSLLLMALYDRCTLHSYMNKLHSPLLDFFFKYITYLGDGAIFGIAIVIFAFIKRRMILVFGLTGILTLLITYIFKKVLFHGAYRPTMDVGVDSLHLVYGVEVALWGTFPSGHTITIFAVMVTLCLYFRQSKLQYWFIIMALLVALSRVYLSLHFLRDIVVGSTFGVLIAFLSMTLIYKVTSNAKENIKD